MMVYPPIDKLIKKAECRYALTCAVAKRARTIVAQEPLPAVRFTKANKKS